MNIKSKISGFVLIAISVTAFMSLKKPVIDNKEIIGAWGYGTPENKTVMIATDRVFSVATYDVPGKKLIASYGGTWKLGGNKMIQKIEWNATDSSQVGREVLQNLSLVNGKLNMAGQSWDRLDDGRPGALQGAWIITGNFQNDKAVKRQNSFYPRRTMKVLSGKYFHWIAYHVGNKTFANAGGGTYTTSKGKYTEQIEFFTKTPESVGKTLKFDYSFVNGDWRHKGQKSTGGSMDECWSKRETLEK